MRWSSLRGSISVFRSQLTSSVWRGVDTMQRIFHHWITLTQLVNLNNQAIGILGYRLHLETSATKKADLIFSHVLPGTRVSLNTNIHWQGWPRATEKGVTMTPGPMDFRGPMGFRKAVGFSGPSRGPMSSRGAHRNDTEKSACEAWRPFFLEIT